MALSQRLDLRQTQSLVMTPQLQQAIKLLQLSNLELSEFVEREVEQNPLLEIDDGEGDRRAAGEASGVDREEPATAPADAGHLDSHDHATAESYVADANAPLDTDFENVWTNGSAADSAAEGSGAESFAQWSARGGRTGFDGEEFGLEQTLTREVSLREHLLGQLNVDLDSAADRLIGAMLIDLLDEAGYLRGDLGEVAHALDCDTARVEAVLAQMQRFDPPGIFARNLAECLALQLAERNRLDPAMQALLDHLDLLAARNTAALMRLCGVDAEDLAGMIAEIKALDPKPALAFDAVEAPAVTPDILMRTQPGGGWIIELNAETLPRVLLNHRYHARISHRARSKEERDYVAECLHSANWLVKSLHQRANTILRVATEIVSQQDAFFRHGVEHLRPLILRDIADAIGMHESTVSRVTTNKFLAGPRGIFELKYFFTSSISGANGHGAHSAEAVRFRIRGLINAETPDAVLSDDRIVEVLREGGIDIARRTVAKYREAMRIPSSVQRRRDKSLQL